MQLRPGWPMAEMGYVVIGPDGLFRLQRVDLYFGDHAEDILEAMKGEG